MKGGSQLGFKKLPTHIGGKLAFGKKLRSQTKLPGADGCISDRSQGSVLASQSRLHKGASGSKLSLASINEKP